MSEEEYQRAGAGEWIFKGTSVAGIPLPGGRAGGQAGGLCLQCWAPACRIVYSAGGSAASAGSGGVTCTTPCLSAPAPAVAANLEQRGRPGWRRTRWLLVVVLLLRGLLGGGVLSTGAAGREYARLADLGRHCLALPASSLPVPVPTPALLTTVNAGLHAHAKCALTRRAAPRLACGAGLYNITPLPSGITGLAALNPALSALVSTNPGIAAMMTASIEEDEVRAALCPAVLGGTLLGSAMLGPLRLATLHYSSGSGSGVQLGMAVAAPLTCVPASGVSE